VGLARTLRKNFENYQIQPHPLPRVTTADHFIEQLATGLPKKKKKVFGNHIPLSGDMENFLKIFIAPLFFFSKASPYQVVSPDDLLLLL